MPRKMSLKQLPDLWKHNKKSEKGSLRAMEMVIRIEEGEEALVAHAPTRTMRHTHVKRSSRSLQVSFHTSWIFSFTFSFTISFSFSNCNCNSPPRCCCLCHSLTLSLAGLVALWGVHWTRTETTENRQRKGKSNKIKANRAASRQTKPKNAMRDFAGKLGRPTDIDNDFRSFPAALNR